MPGTISVCDFDATALQSAVNAGGPYLKHVYGSLEDLVEAKPCILQCDDAQGCLAMEPGEADIVSGSGSCHAFS